MCLTWRCKMLPVHTQPKIKQGGMNDTGPSYNGSLCNGGIGSTLAVTFGIHTLIASFGENGDDWGRDEGIFQLPELGLETSVRPGDCLFFRASILAHCVTPLPTCFHRCVLTIFKCLLVAGTLAGTRKPKKSKSKLKSMSTTSTSKKMTRAKQRKHPVNKDKQE